MQRGLSPSGLPRNVLYIYMAHYRHSCSLILGSDNIRIADPGGRAVQGVVLRQLAYWDWELESLL